MNFRKVEDAIERESLVETLENSLNQPYDTIKVELKKVSPGFVDINVTAYLKDEMVQKSFSSIRETDVAKQLVKEHIYSLKQEGNVNYQIPEIDLPYRSKDEN